MPPPLPLAVSVLSFRAASLYPGMLRKVLHTVGLVHVSVITMISGLRSTAVALSSCIFEIRLRALVDNIVSFLSGVISGDSQVF